MTITVEHVQAPRQGAPSTAQPTVHRTAPRLGLRTLLCEAVTAARASSTADPRTSVAVARRFAQRLSG